jgi:hypothetical protein
MSDFLDIDFPAISSGFQESGRFGEIKRSAEICQAEMCISCQKKNLFAPFGKLPCPMA